MMDVGLAGAFIAGVLTLFSPCSALLLPAFFAYAFDGLGRLLVRTGTFFLGLALVLVPLGAGVGAMGALVTEHRSLLTTLAGIILVALGLVTIVGGGFSFAPIERLRTSLRLDRHVSVLVLGMTYGFAGFCSGPLLGAVLTLAMTTGTPTYGGLLLGMYGAGMSLPLFVLAFTWDRFELSKKRWLRGREIEIGVFRVHSTLLTSGILLILAGVLFLATEGTALLPGLMGVDAHTRLQVWIGRWANRIPDVFTVGVILLLVGLLMVRRYRKVARNEKKS